MTRPGAELGTGTSGVQPFFFGPPGGELFAVLDPPADARRARDCGVVVCQPVGQEHVRCHRALRLLARRLSEAGFPVLRFDFHGCGDSAGELDGARLARWVADVAAAGAQLRARCSPARLAVVGLRLGATLAWRAAAGALEVDRLVLWEPVASGAAYRRELDAQHAALSGAPAHGPPAHGSDGSVESLGFVHSRELLADLDELDLERELAADRGPATRRVLVLEQDPGAADGEAASRADGARVGGAQTGGAARVERRRVAGTRFWLDEPFQVAIPEAGIRAVTAWLERWA